MLAAPKQVREPPARKTRRMPKADSAFANASLSAGPARGAVQDRAPGGRQPKAADGAGRPGFAAASCLQPAGSPLSTQVMACSIG